MKIIDHDNEEHLSVRERYKSDEKAILIPKPNGRRLCPICGDDNHYNIHEIIDKAQVFCDYPRIYGKKYYCDQCGVEWKEF
jgi:hypothetical protein